MWALLSRRLWMWLLFALGAPALSWALGTLAERLERRHGRTPLTQALGFARNRLRNRSRGSRHDRGRSRGLRRH